MTWRYRAFRCSHGFVHGQNCPDCKGKAPRKRRPSVQKTNRHQVPKGYGPDEPNAREVL